MGQKLASVAALLVGGIITPSAASADDNSTWLLQTGAAVGPKPAGSPEGEPSLLDGDVSEWLEPGPAKPISGKSPKDAQPSASASSNFAKTDPASWLTTKPSGPKPPAREARGGGTEAARAGTRTCITGVAFVASRNNAVVHSR